MSKKVVEPEGSGRVPLTARRAVSVFGITVVGFMTANLVPIMIVALTGELGFSVTDAGVLMTASLLACAASCLLTSRWSAHGGRYVVARLGLVLAAAGFGAAAFIPSVPVVIAGVVLGGLGAGGAVSAGGAALSALRNPDRASGINGFTNRAIVSVVLFAIPALGAGMGSAFGLLAGLALAALLTTGWLPDRPAPAVTTASTAPVPGASAKPSRTLMSAGVGLLACFALWALSEDSLWAVAATMGAEQAGLDEAGMGLALSLSTLGGLVATAVVSLFGRRLGRTLPLAVVLVAGGLLKVLAGAVTDPGWYLVVIIAWNTLYAAAFVYIIAVAAALDATGRWSAPLLGVYLIGSAFAPVFGTFLSAGIGYPGMGMVLAGMTFALLIPFLIISRVSVRTETAADTAARDAEFMRAAIV
ncbi:DHA1 family inner membrane transport protein [Arthrobacter sp. V4I6]|uniref:MFS transporter n=1 Tax=unclassified Arthrobacter TaxID=235627 RepID=UPI00277E4407|nr:MULTISPECIES: MFS transporter [unclassified Arthrobacter]MDQ0819551.1 DHA1 family inner membrane transport protein [Arthrobacter sp. V1I7]MDQ0853732.1 DHA1 family inner membrane transport protein [Arthrobacter sp. V4I6]